MPWRPIRDHLKVLDDLPYRVVAGSIVPMGHELAFERPEEAFEAGVVPTVTFPAHARGDAVLAEQTLVTPDGIVAAAIRVVQEPASGFRFASAMVRARSVRSTVSR